MCGQVGPPDGPVVPDEQAKWLQDAGNSVKRNAFYMKRALVRPSAGRKLAGAVLRAHLTDELVDTYGKLQAGLDDLTVASPSKPKSRLL